MHAKSYVPGYVPPTTKSLPSPGFQAPSAGSPTFPPAPSATPFNGPPQQSRKRSYNESNGGAGGPHSYGSENRQMKQMRRSSGMGARDNSLGGRGGRGGYHPTPVSHGGPSTSLPGFPSNMPFPPPPPGTNLDDPMAAIMAMQAMGLPPLPGMPAFPSSGSPPAPQYGQSSPGQQPKNKINARCRDYDTKGVCTRGVNCPFIHENSIVMPDQEYDPKNAVMTDVQMSPTTPSGLNFPLSDPQTNGHHHTSRRGRGRGDRGSFNPGRRNNRAEFSHAGPNYDRSLTTIVVEQIPEENFSEESVRSFFTQFGTIEDVNMQAYKRLALVKFSDYASANRAHQSPKVIFDNRFVKVFWYKPASSTDASSNGGPIPTPTPSTSEPDFNKEKFARDAEVAQKKHEEKQALLKDAESKRQVLGKQQEELARRQAEEKRKLQEKLAAKGQASPPSLEPSEQTNGTTTNGNKDENVSAQTRALRAQVAALEAEAKSLGLDHALSEDPWTAQRGRGRGRGRGSYRGWEGFAGRGRYAPRGRGGHRGRAGSSAALGYNLDLRPKRVAVGGADWTESKDEGLRQFLLVSQRTKPSPPLSGRGGDLFLRTKKQRTSS